MIKAIFYSKFDPQEGPKVVHQVPDGAIVPSPSTAPPQSPFFTFSDISFYVIPRQELCGNLLQVCIGGHRILGYPICMKSPRYDRNEFIFNFCLVLEEDQDFSMYKSVVQKLAHLMHGLEEQNGFLSRDFSKSGEGKVYSLCETLMEDLNNYSECMIPIDELNTLNIKLFPIYPAPPSIKSWQVPLFTVRFEAFMDENWDLTMQKIVPYINGINSVRIISILADVEFSLACRAIKHLLYYGCVFLLDIFSFSAIYAPTAQFSSTIARDDGMQQECARYVNTKFAPVQSIPMAPPSAVVGAAAGTFNSRSEVGSPHAAHGHRYFDSDDIWPVIGNPSDELTSASGKTGGGNKTTTTAKSKVVDGVGIVQLYASLKQGQSVKQWYSQHTQQLANIDIRRFITFGIIKGFLYRVHKYALATGISPASTHTNPTTAASSIKGGVLSSNGDWSRNPSLHNGRSGYETPEHDDHLQPRLDTNIRSTGTMLTPAIVTPTSFRSSESKPSTASTTGMGTGTSSRLTHSRTHSHDSTQEDRPRRHHHSHHHHHDSFVDEDNSNSDSESIGNTALAKYLDGTHCFDEICTELEISERELAAKIKKWPFEVQIIHR